MVEKIKQNLKKFLMLMLVMAFIICGVFFEFVPKLENFIGAAESLFSRLRETAYFDYFRPDPASGKARVLVANIRHDKNGRYTAEIREMLRRDGKRYRMLEREYKEEDEEGGWEDLANLLERHKSILLLEGAVSGYGKTIRIRIRNRDGRINKRANIELSESSAWTEKLSTLIVEGTQELVDNVQLERITIEEYEDLAETVKDALEQSETEEERLQAQFQLANIEGHIAFLKRDTEATLAVLEIYEKLFQKYEGEYQEGPIRMNMGVGYENVGRMTGNRTLKTKAKAEYIRAEEIFKKHENIEKVLKARMARFKIERNEWFEEAKKGGVRDISRLIEMRNAIVEMLDLHPDKISGLQGWLSNEERLYIDLLWAAAIKNREKYEQAKQDLEREREYFWEEVSKRGFEANPWALSILLCRDEWQAEELWEQGQIVK